MTNSTTETQEIKQLINTLSGQLNERFNKIDKCFDKVEEKIEALEKQQIETKIEVKESIARIEGKLQAWEPSINKITDLAERMGELKNWRQIALIGFAAALGWFLRGRQF